MSEPRPTEPTPAPLSDEEIGNLRAWLAQAPGRWTVDPAKTCEDNAHVYHERGGWIGEVQCNHDAEAIVAMRNALPSLLAEVAASQTRAGQAHEDYRIQTTAIGDAMQALTDAGVPFDTLANGIRTLASRTRAAATWQGMASAPKDGRAVLLWWPYWSSQRPVVGWWQVNGGWQSVEMLEGESEPPKAWLPLPPATPPEDRS